MLRKWIREIGRLLSFKPAQHVLLVIEASKEVCEEEGEEWDNSCDRGDDKHAAKKQKNLEINKVINESLGTRFSLIRGRLLVNQKRIRPGH